MYLILILTLTTFAFATGGLLAKKICDEMDRDMKINDEVRS